MESELVESKLRREFESRVAEAALEPVSDLASTFAAVPDALFVQPKAWSQCPSGGACLAIEPTSEQVWTTEHAIALWDTLFPLENHDFSIILLRHLAISNLKVGPSFLPHLVQFATLLLHPSYWKLQSLELNEAAPGSLASLFDSDAARVLGGLCRLKIVESQQGVVRGLGPSHWLALWQLAPLHYFELSAPDFGLSSLAHALHWLVHADSLRSQARCAEHAHQGARSTLRLLCIDCCGSKEEEDVEGAAGVDSGNAKTVVDLLVSLMLSAPRLEELCVGLPPSTLEWTCDGALVRLLVDAWQRRASAAEDDAPVYVSWGDYGAGVLRLASSVRTHPLRSGPIEHVEPVFVRANEEDHTEKIGALLPQPFFAVDMVRDEVDRPALGQGLPVALPAVPERRGRVRDSFIDDRGIDIEHSPERDIKENSAESLDRGESMEEDHGSPRGPRSALAAARGTQPSQLFHIPDGRLDDDDIAARKYAKAIPAMIKRIPDREDAKKAKRSFSQWYSMASDPWDRRRWINPRQDREDSPELLGLLNQLYDLLEKYNLCLDFPFPLRRPGQGARAYLEPPQPHPMATNNLLLVPSSNSPPTVLARPSVPSPAAQRDARRRKVMTVGDDDDDDDFVKPAESKENLPSGLCNKSSAIIEALSDSD